ncbi:MAG TPA: DUF2934 domain-containing protein [Bryobacteraceae bacterium]|nr:DUF2934 domain-containing protein [Bryobacteraceae bacterium]
MVQKTKEKDETKKSQQTQRPEPEPDVTVHDHVNDSIFARPAHEEIAVLAYSYWTERGAQGGSAEEDWLRAERELRERNGAAADR